MAAPLRWIAALVLPATASAAQPAATFTADRAPIRAAPCARRQPRPPKATRHVPALDLHPGNRRVVPHATLGTDRTRSSRQLGARDPEPGYAGGMERDARYPEGQLLGWTPGQAPHRVPDGTQWRLEPGSDLVVQLHLQPTGKAERVGVTVGFFFTAAAPTRTPVGLRL